MQELYDKLFTPLGDDQIKKALPDVPIVRYEELEKYNSIEQLLPKARSAAVIFLATTSPNKGHWFAVMRSKKKIYYFDAYGKRPDKNLEFTPKNLRKEFGQNIPYLSYLLNKAIDDGFKVSFNEVQYQSSDPAIQTCGYWIISRILFNLYEVNNNPRSYRKLIKKLMKEHELTSDLLIVKLIDF
jgi:hypothetical protein